MRDTAELVRDIEDKIRINTATKGMRVNEFFHDYDRLRSGYVTKTQFQRVLNQHFKLLLSPEEEKLLIGKYNFKGDDKVCYREFCAIIYQEFPANEMTLNPESQVFKNPEYLGTFRSTRFLDQENMSRIESLLNFLYTYYQKNGIEVLTNFHDFDRSNTGAVTEAQFHRGLTEPKLPRDDIQLLVEKYKDPAKPGKVNYMNLHYDIVSFGKSKASMEEPKYAQKSETLFVDRERPFSIQEILDKVILAAHKNGIRVIDFFKDYDKLRSGVVTEHQFVCALSLAVEKQANLSRNEISKLVENYKQPDGRCYYRTFTEQIENAFNIPELEKKPTVQARRPATGLLGRTLNSNLSPEDDEIIQHALAVIIEKVHKRRLQLFPYFKDFDRSKAYSRCVTKLQFGRVLSMLDLMPTANEYRLICEKFEERISGDVNYPAFCHAVDDEFFASIVDKEIEPEFENKYNDVVIPPPDISSVDMNDLLARIRTHVLSNRIRIKEFFEDMDPLRSGKMTKSRFLRCLSSIGISSIDALNFNKAQLHALIMKYEDPVDNLKVDWKKFETDVESVFTIQNIERDPNIRVPRTEIFEMLPPGSVDFTKADKLNESDYNSILLKWKRKVEQRRIDCWPPFKDFDKLNRGHITNQQFRQGLAILDLVGSEAEIVAVSAKFMNDYGFNYVKFLNELQPSVVWEPKFSKLQQELADLNGNKVLEEFRPATNIQSVLKKIKDLVLKKRVRIYEWLRDHDKLNSGRLPKETFRRAIDLCNFEVKEAEHALLEDFFKSPKDPLAIEYKKFCVEVESIFADDQLEKNPLIDAKQYILERNITQNYLTADAEDMVVNGLKKIAERVRRYRMQLFPKFEDFDRVKNGFVSKNQFRRVLSDLDLATLLNELEFKNICDKFRVQIGTRDDIDYVTLCDTLYALGGFEYRRP